MVTFPEASTAVTVTVLLPNIVQSNAAGATVIEVIPQLSDADATTCVVFKVASPLTSKERATGVLTKVTAGAVLSTIVTTTVSELLFPEPSTAVTTTAFAPLDEHVNWVLL